MLVDSLGYFRRGEHGETAFLTGAILSFLLAILLEFRLFPFVTLAVVPGVALVGYFSRILVTSADGAVEPPPLSVSRTLVVELLAAGVRTSVVAGLFLLVPIGLLVATIRGALSAAGAGSMESGITTGIYVGSIVVLFTTLAFAYLVPAAVVIESRQTIRAAFRSGELRHLVGHAAYFHAWAVGLAVTGIGLSIALGAAGISVIGPALAIFVALYTISTACHLIGRGCARATKRR